MMWRPGRNFRAVRRTGLLGSAALAIAGLLCGGEGFARPALEQHLPGATSAPLDFQGGYDALAKGDAARARAAFGALLHADPHDPRGYIGLADVEIEQADYAAAWKFLSKGMDAVPDDPRLLRSGAHLAGLEHRYGRARDLLAEAISLDPDQIQIRLDLARLYAGPLNAPKQALDQYAAAIRIAPSDADAQYEYAEALAGQNRIADALKVLSDAQTAARANPIPSLTAAQIYLRDRQLSEALAKADQVLAISPGLEAGNLLRGAIFQRFGRYDAALEIYRALLKANPQSVPAHLGIGLTLQAMGRQDEAFGEFKTVLAADPHNVLALNNLAWISATRKSNLDQARQWILLAVAQQPDDAALRDTLGWVYRQSGDLEAARAELQRGLSWTPSASLYYHLGVVDAALGRKAAAVRLFQQALVLEPWMGEAMTALWELDADAS
jgi:tetratricopeptide (TPR) repeat protein